ncbi:NAD-dependent epimerase/dehydratase family protein [Siphonobacter sp.]|uniref:NAD-dependent epimerase/dehydratase family protein n=1 Tax=Siphonobacter sp. TaxID=1869184 RepID=UPI003B3BAEEF
MKILLTGATGLLGSHIAGALLRQGYAVKAMYRSLPQAISQLPWYHQVEWVQGQMTSLPDLERAAYDCLAIVHAAARTEPYPSNVEAYFDANVLATRQILEVTRRLSMQRLVYVSTAAIYQPGTYENPATEESPFAFDLMQSGYIASKYQAQQEVLEAVVEGVPAVIVNPTFLLGPYDFKPSSGALISYVLKNRRVFFPGSGGKNFIDVRDAADATVQALQKGRIGESYLLAATNVPYEVFFETVASLLPEKRSLIPMPRKLMRSVGRLGTFAERLLGHPLRLNYINTVLVTQDNYYSGQRARQELGLMSTPFQDSVRDTIHWFQGESFINAFQS